MDKMTIKQHLQLIYRGYKLLANFPKPMFLSRTLAILTRASTPFINIWFSAQILNELVGARDSQRLIFLISLTIGLNLAANLLGSALNRWQEYCSSQNWRIILNSLTEKLLSMDFIDVENPEIQQQYALIRQHQEGMGFGVVRLVQAYDIILDGIIRIILSAAFAFTMFTYRVPENSPLAFLDSAWIIAIVLIFFVCNIFLGPYISSVGGRIWATASDMNSRGNRFFRFYFHDMISGNDKAKDIRLYNQESMIDSSLNDLFGRDNWLKIASFAAKHNSVNSAIAQLSNGVIYLYVALKAFAGAFGVGNIVLYAGAIMQLGNGFNSILSNMSQLTNNTPYLEKWMNFLDIPNKKYLGTIPVEKRDDNQYDIEFHNVSFKYPGSEEYALKNLSFKLQIGQKLAVVGMNGSGKTTMIKLLCRLYDPTEGEITLNGIDIRKYNYDEYMEIFGVVFQDFGLLPFTLGENVAASINYDKDQAMEYLQQAGFGERLETLPHGLDTYLYKYFEEEGVEISGGEAQKIALARALYKNSPFIVLDEPTAALDPVAEYEIYAKFNEMVKDKTAVYISHRLASCRFCDDIAVFHEGQMIQRGNHDELMENPNGKYFELWNAQAQYYA